MPTPAYPSREAAKRAALRLIGREMDAAQTVCVKVFQTLHEITVFEVDGRSRKLLDRFRWSKERG